MKYIVVIGDGMADTPIEELSNKTPLQTAVKPMMDYMAKNGICGYAKTVPEGMVPESDTANLGIMGYDPEKYSKGRSPLEAMSIGLDMLPDDTAYRCNVVTLSEGDIYDNLTIIDHSADEISTEEADKLIKAIDEKLGDKFKRFHTGTSYRHCLLWEKSPKPYNFMRPHDILGKCIKEYLPKGREGEPFLKLMKESYEILNNHPINQARREKGLKPANSIWLWSPGQKPDLPDFYEKYGLKGSVISAVDLLKGIGVCAGMKVVEVEGATGNYKTNYSGKAKAALNELLNGKDFVYLHVEAPDECGHRAEIDNKVKSIEKIDLEIISFLKKRLEEEKQDYRMLFMPDHPTPIALRTHSSDPVPFVIYDSRKAFVSGKESYDEYFGNKEKSIEGSGCMYVEKGHELMDILLEK